MKPSFPTLAFGCTLLLAPLTLANTADTTPAEKLDLSRYLGTWHETARFDNIFERGLHAVTALYERMADGRIRVTNSGTNEAGKRRNASGVAQQAEGGSGGDLEVSFVPPYSHFFSDYRILYVTPDYSGALVSNASGDMLWLLERNEKSDPEVRERLLEEARQRGFDTTELIFDDDSGATSMDSEAEINAE